MLEFQGVSKSYGSFQAVSDLDLVVQAGEFFSLLGPSGCGKTTLLRMLAGFETPTGGQILYRGESLSRIPSHRRPVHLVFQKYALFPHLNVRENVAFGLRMKKVAEPELSRRLAEALELVQLGSQADRAIQTLSGGQQQRVALARALINRPDILLLDEPLSALDLKLRQQMQVELRELQRRIAHTFLFVTHDQEEALTLSDRIAVMSAGRIEQVGTPQEIYEFPRTLFVARFIGSIHEFESTVAEASAQEVVVRPDFAPAHVLKVHPSRDGSRALPALRPGERVRVLVRPEKLRLLRAPGSSTNLNVLPGRLRESIYQGPATLSYVDVSEGRLPAISVSTPNSALSARRAFAIGDSVVVAWEPEDCLVLRETSHG
jgi:spermidine/putrescine transport system ATP-binding protein